MSLQSLSLGSDKENLNMPHGSVDNATKGKKYREDVKKKRRKAGTVGRSRKRKRVVDLGAETRPEGAGLSALGDGAGDNKESLQISRELKGDQIGHVAVPSTISPDRTTHGSEEGPGRGECSFVEAWTEASSFDSPRLLQSQEDTAEEYSQEPYLSEDTLLDSRYRILQILGHGSFSTTYLAEEAPSEPEPPDLPPQLVAIKRLKQPFALIGENEFSLLEFLHQEGEKPRHIISPITGFFSETGHFHLVLEPLDSARPVSLPNCCCISRTVHSKLACPLRHLSLAKMLVQLLSGLLSLHSHNLIHADLTPANVLFLPSSNRVKLIDLGNVIRLEDREAYLDDFEVQSACYRAPEILLGSGPLSRVMDVWSTGVIAVEMLLDGAIIGEGLEGAELMRSGVSGREALVKRIVELVGSVKEYTGGIYYTDVYDDISLESVGFTQKAKKQNFLEVESRGILRSVLEDATRDVGLVDFLLGMMEVGVGRRKTVPEALKHSWLIEQLLGNWGNILMHRVEEEDGWNGGVNDLDQFKLEALEGRGDFEGVRESEGMEDVLQDDDLVFLSGRQDEEDELAEGSDRAFWVNNDGIRENLTDRLPPDLRSPSPHPSRWEDISDSPPPSPGHEVEVGGVEQEQANDGWEPDLSPLPVGQSSLYHSQWEEISDSPPPEHQSLLGRVKRECSSSIIEFRFKSDDGVEDYLTHPRGESTDNSVPETSLITNNDTTHLTLGQSTFSSPPSSPPQPALKFLEEDGPTSTTEACPPPPVAFIRGVECAEQVESALVFNKNKEGTMRGASGIWDRDLAADMDDISEETDDDQVMLC